jgi:hypothetical protein
MLKRHLACLAFALLAVGLVAACDDSPETGRLILSVAGVNGGSPVESDVATDSLVTEDLISVQFAARPYNEFVTAVPGGPHSTLIVDKYRIVWTRVDAGTGTLASREETTSIFVDAFSTSGSGGVIRLVTWDDKNGPVLSPLVGTANTILMQAEVTFSAHEPGTESEIETKTTIQVHFADTI